MPGRFCRAGPKRTASPLTPALSPLRGEGGAQCAFEICAHQRAEISRRDSIARRGEAIRQNWPCVAVEKAVASSGARRVDALPARTSAFEVTRAPNATPSPLKGERAGVRGEAVPTLVRPDARRSFAFSVEAFDFRRSTPVILSATRPGSAS